MKKKRKKSKRKKKQMKKVLKTPKKILLTIKMRCIKTVKDLMSQK